MNGQGEWSEAYQKAIAFVSQLTLAEKVNLTTGAGYVLRSHFISIEARKQVLTYRTVGSRSCVSAKLEPFLGTFLPIGHG
jgi:hypothetical protein